MRDYASFENFIVSIVKTSKVIIISFDCDVHHYSNVDEMPEWVFSQYCEFLHSPKVVGRTIAYDTNVYELKSEVKK